MTFSFLYAACLGFREGIRALAWCFVLAFKVFRTIPKGLLSLV